MKNTKLAASLLAVSMLATTVLAGCNDTTPNDSGNNSTPGGNSGSGDNSGSGQTIDTNAEWKQTLTYDASTVIRMACGYNSPATGIRFDADTAKDGVTLADGKTYHTNDFKPTWVAVMDKLKFSIEDKYQGNSASKEFPLWQEQLDAIDFVAGGASDLTAAGNAGMLLNIADYLDSMPYFSAYLARNPIVRLSITASTTGQSEGAIYFSPYFDGVNDIERMPLMRTDWVAKLLNGEGKFEADKSGETAEAVYQPYMPTSGSVDIEVVKLDGSGTETIKKDYSKYGNIVAKMNDKGKQSGVDAVNMLRDYIDATYDGYYGTERANLFIGQNAAWDADELVALLRCIVANSNTLNNSDTIYGIFTRTENSNQRNVDMFRLAGHLFGVRGLESRQDYLYVGNDNKLHDARTEEDTYKAMERMHWMVQEGLISPEFVSGANKIETPNYLEQDLGFMHYDYSQTQTVYNKTKLDEAAGENYTAVMVPVAIWNDGTGTKYMRFTESWRSVKTDGWAISLAGVGYSATNPAPKDASQLTDKAKAILTLIDYAYSKEGMILMSYGPDDFLKKDGSGNIQYFNFNGEQWPVISDKNAEDLWTYANGSYTDYARKYIGSTLSFVKSQAFEYQCTYDAGKIGAQKISTAIALGTIKHPELALSSNPWYTSVPTVLPNTDAEVGEINAQADLKSQFGTSNNQINKLLDIIRKGFGDAGFTSAAEAAKTVDETYGAKIATDYRNRAWERLVEYYKSL